MEDVPIDIPSEPHAPPCHTPPKESCIKKFGRKILYGLAISYGLMMFIWLCVVTAQINVLSEPSPLPIAPVINMTEFNISTFVPEYVPDSVVPFD